MYCHCTTRKTVKITNNFFENYDRCCFWWPFNKRAFWYDGGALGFKHKITSSVIFWILSTIAVGTSSPKWKRNNTDNEDWDFSNANTVFYVGIAFTTVIAVDLFLVLLKVFIFIHFFFFFFFYIDLVKRIRFEIKNQPLRTWTITNQWHDAADRVDGSSNELKHFSMVFHINVTLKKLLILKTISVGFEILVWNRFSTLEVQRPPDADGMYEKSNESACS